jgi:CBS domain-containing protein
MFLVKDAMTRSVVTVSPNTSIQNVAKKMAESHISSVIVIENNTPIGIVCERDFVNKVLAKKSQTKNLTAKDVMSSPLITLKPKDTIHKAVSLMSSKSVRHFVIVEDNRLLGIITETDLVNSHSEYIKSQQVLQNLILTIFMILVLIFILISNLI